MFEEFENTKTKIENLIEGYKFRDALYEVIDLARKGNKYMQDKEPWIEDKKKQLLKMQLMERHKVSSNRKYMWY